MRNGKEKLDDVCVEFLSALIVGENRSNVALFTPLLFEKICPNDYGDLDLWLTSQISFESLKKTFGIQIFVNENIVLFPVGVQNHSRLVVFYNIDNLRSGGTASILYLDSYEEDPSRPQIELMA